MSFCLLKRHSATSVLSSKVRTQAGFLPVHVLPGGDGEGVSAAARPQQHVAFLGLPLEQEHRLQTGNVVVTPAGPQNHVSQRVFLKKRV